MFEKIKSRITFNAIIVFLSIMATIGWIYIAVNNYYNNENRQRDIATAILELREAENQNIASHLIITGKLIIVETNIENINKDIETIKKSIKDKYPVIIIPKELGN
jgi:transposase-like protein